MRKRLVLGHEANQSQLNRCGVGESGAGQAFQQQSRPSPRSWNPVGSGRGAPPRPARGGGATSAPPRPLAAAPGAGRGCQMLGRLRELRSARSRGARQRVKAPLARPPGPLRATPAGVFRGTGRPGGGSGRGMHSTRLDSFLGQLRWELVRLGIGVTLKGVCGVLCCQRPKDTRVGGCPECSS